MPLQQPSLGLQDQVRASIPQPPCTSVDLHHAGHRAAVLDLAACSARPGQVLSLSQDASARLWDVVEETCLAVWTLDALSLVRVDTTYLPTLGGLICLVPGGDVLCWGLCRGTEHGCMSTEINGLPAGGLKLQTPLMTACCCVKRVVQCAAI